MHQQFEDKHYKKRIVDKWGGEDFIDRSQQEIIDSDDPEYIMQQIRAQTSWMHQDALLMTF